MRCARTSPVTLLGISNEVLVNVQAARPKCCSWGASGSAQSGFTLVELRGLRAKRDSD